MSQVHCDLSFSCRSWIGDQLEGHCRTLVTNRIGRNLISQVYGRHSNQSRNRHHGGISPEWPISYDNLESNYTQAEQLYYVHGNGNRQAENAGGLTVRDPDGRGLEIGASRY